MNLVLMTTSALAGKPNEESQPEPEAGAQVRVHARNVPFWSGTTMVAKKGGDSLDSYKDEWEDLPSWANLRFDWLWGCWEARQKASTRY